MSSAKKNSLLRQLLMQTPNALQLTIKPSASIIPKNQKAQHNNAIFLSVKISELAYINAVLHDCPWLWIPANKFKCSAQKTAEELRILQLRICLKPSKCLIIGVMVLSHMASSNFKPETVNIRDYFIRFLKNKLIIRVSFYWAWLPRQGYCV